MLRKVSLSILFLSSITVASEQKENLLSIKRKNFFCTPRRTGFEVQKGPWLGSVLYVGTKALIYGIVGAVVQKTAKTVINSAADVASRHIDQKNVEIVASTCTGLVPVPVVLAGTHSGVISSVIENSATAYPEMYSAVINGGTAGAALTVSQAGSVGAAIGWVEAVATAVGAWGTSLPTP